jgi:putative spermidine/putrescine transport system substrate-binding protein
MTWEGNPISRRRYLQITGGLAGLAIVSTAETGAAQSDYQLVVTIPGGAFEKFVREVVFPEFEKRTGGKLIGFTGLTMQNLAKLRASRDNPAFDVVRMDPPGMIPAAQEGLLHKLDPDKIPNLKDLFPWAVPESKY